MDTKYSNDMHSNREPVGVPFAWTEKQDKDFFVEYCGEHDAPKGHLSQIIAEAHDRLHQTINKAVQYYCRKLQFDWLPPLSAMDISEKSEWLLQLVRESVKTPESFERFCECIGWCIWSDNERRRTFKLHVLSLSPRYLRPFWEVYDALLGAESLLHECLTCENSDYASEEEQ